jgi:CheY-like chemotaxis protein
VELQAQAARGKGELILVIDDEKAMRELMAVELTEAGYRVLTAETADEASTLLRQSYEERNCHPHVRCRALECQPVARAE